MTEQQTIDALLYREDYKTLLAEKGFRLELYVTIQENGSTKSCFVITNKNVHEHFDFLNLAVARYFELIKS